MGLRESFELITEELKRQFYSDTEARVERFKDSTQIAKEEDLENPHIPYDPFSSYINNQMGIAAQQMGSYNEMVRKWREISMLPEVDEAISEITSEAICFDEIDDVVSLNLDNIELSENIKSKMRESFHKILYLLDFNERGEELFRQWYVDATLNFEVVYNNRKIKNGIQKLVLLPPYNIFKFKNEKSGEVKWFFNSKPTYNIMKDLNNAEKTYYDEQFTQINSGVFSQDKKTYHSYLQKAVKSINQLYLLEDTLIIFRLTRAPEKRVFYIDTGNLPKNKAEEYVKGLINKYRQKKIYNTDAGTIENKNKSVSILEDFWFPISNTGKGTKVETLSGLNPNFSAFDDVNYFVDKVYRSLNVPRSRTNKEDRVTVLNNLDIEREELKFWKLVLKLRRRFNNLFVDLLKKDLIASQVMSFDDWMKIQEKIKFIYANSNEISTIKSTQIAQIKMEAASMGLSLIEQKLVSPKWLQKNILRLSDEEITEISQNLGGMASGAENDALGGIPSGGEQEVPGYEEVGGSEPPTEETPEETPKGRFQQKPRE